VGKTLASPWSLGRKYFKDPSPPQLKENPPTSSTPESGGVARINKPRCFSLLRRAQHSISVPARRREGGTTSEAWVHPHRYLYLAFMGIHPLLSAVTLQHPELS